MISVTPYVRSVHPRLFVLPTGVGVINLHHEIARDEHKEELRVFVEAVDVEICLLKQLVQAMPEL